MAKKLSRNGFALLAGIIISLLLIIAVLAFVFVMITPGENSDSLILNNTPLSAEEMKREDAPKILQGAVPDGTQPNQVYYYDDGQPKEVVHDIEESGPTDGAHIIPTEDAGEDLQEGIEDATDGVTEPVEIDADANAELETDTNR